MSRSPLQICLAIATLLQLLTCAARADDYFANRDRWKAELIGIGENAGLDVSKAKFAVAVALQFWYKTKCGGNITDMNTVTTIPAFSIITSAAGEDAYSLALLAMTGYLLAQASFANADALQNTCRFAREF